MKIIQEGFASPKSRIGVLVTRFNYLINKNLLEGAVNTLTRIGQITDKNITVIWIPGAYELPLAACTLIKEEKCDAIIALGSIVRGKTKHYKYIAHSSINGLSQISQNTGIPISLGILTTENLEQAIERSGGKVGNKGVEAALTALEMINIIKIIKEEN